MTPSLIRPLPRPHASRTLLCMSFCGGGTASFRAWADAVPEDVELLLHCYPGREGRFTTPFARTWEELLADALESVRALPRRPYVLFGHSMGAWVAFDLARRAAAVGLTPPRALVLSASDAPTRPRDAAAPPSLHHTDEELVDWMRGQGQVSGPLLEDPEIRQIAVEVLRADMRVMDSYRYRAGDRVGVPAQLLLGADDDVDPGAEARWRALCSGGLTARRLPGGHFYTPGTWARLPGFMLPLSDPPAPDVRPPHTPAASPEVPLGSGPRQ